AGDGAAGEGAGMDEYLSKPVRVRGLRAVLERGGEWAAGRAAATDDQTGIHVCSAASPSEANPEPDLEVLHPGPPSRTPAPEREADPEMDLVVLRELRSLATEGWLDLDELVRVFETDARGYLAGIREAAAAGDAAGLRQAAHSLKGAAANMGALALAETALQLEQRGSEGSTDGWEPLAAEAEARFQHAHAYLASGRDAA